MSSPIDKLREQCLQRGAKGILGLSRIFRFMDDNVDKKLDKTELREGLEEYGVTLTNGELNELFNDMDKDSTGTIMFEEFLRAIRPPMSDQRLEMIEQAFDAMDKSGEGLITLEDLRGVYSVADHPRFLSGEKTEEELLQKFLENFDRTDNPDGEIREQANNLILQLELLWAKKAIVTPE